MGARVGKAASAKVCVLLAGGLPDHAFCLAALGLAWPDVGHGSGAVVGCAMAELSRVAI